MKKERPVIPGFISCFIAWENWLGSTLKLAFYEPPSIVAFGTCGLLANASPSSAALMEVCSRELLCFTFSKKSSK